MTNAHQEAVNPSRRTVLAVVGAAGAVAALAGCGSEDSGGTDSGSADGSAEAGAELAQVSDIPEGGGKVFGDQGVVVTQPTAGQFKAFSSKCTHQGCAVGEVADGVINCPCHGSKFDANDGSVKAGPATAPLPEKKLTIEGNSIRLA
ncbi:Rieske (2Fe-2S) protein [Streptomyces sp. NPDC060194]|uniref:Rieske (2Fe-2S) protein n=1 Tax=Streptomyces sp. NPDC060194 TaxID=3347069 RepID=UPI0036562182